MTNNTIPACPICDVENTDSNGKNFLCQACFHEWPAKTESDEVKEKIISA